MKNILALISIISLIISSAVYAGDQSVTLAWDANPESDIAAYIIYSGTNSGAYTQATNVGNITRATVYGLEDGVTSYFALTAVNTAGLESDYSAEVSNVIPFKPVSPVVITNYWNIPPLKFEILLQPAVP